jgi:hypothetical protein
MVTTKLEIDRLRRMEGIEEQYGKRETTERYRADTDEWRPMVGNHVPDVYHSHERFTVTTHMSRI